MASLFTLEGLTEQVAAQSLGFGIGFALGASFTPISTKLEQAAWQGNTIKALDPKDAAAYVAERLAELGWGTSEAEFNGIDADRFLRLVQEAQSAPGFAELVTMLRRDTIQTADFQHGLGKHKLEDRWDVPLEDLQHERLDPAVIAAAIVRGLIKDPGILPVGPPAGEGKVPRFPVFDVDAVKEAAASGYDLARLSVLVGNYGRPMAPDQAARATFRAIVDRIDFDRAISEGDIRNEWADAIFESSRQILTAHDGVEDHLRGWSDVDAMYAQTARHGMSKEDTDILFRITGRPISFHQVFIGLRRGGTYDGPTTDIDPAFLKSLRESNIRPEWYNLAWAQRHVYPTAFVLRALTESGDLTAQQTETILLYEGWEPTLAHDTAAKWAATKSATGSTLSSKAKTSALTALHKSYVDDLSDETFARTLMTELGEPESEQTATIAIWNHERAIRRASLTAKQITNAIGTPGHDEAWATARLSELGYNADEISALLGK